VVEVLVVVPDVSVDHPKKVPLVQVEKVVGVFGLHASLVSGPRISRGLFTPAPCETSAFILL